MALVDIGFMMGDLKHIEENKNKQWRVKSVLTHFKNNWGKKTRLNKLLLKKGLLTAKAEVHILRFLLSTLLSTSTRLQSKMITITNIRQSTRFPNDMDGTLLLRQNYIYPKYSKHWPYTVAHTIETIWQTSATKQKFVFIICLIL